MTQSEFDQKRMELDARCIAIMGPKRADYTGLSPDVMTNFKEVATRTGLSPMQAWAVYFLKHIDAITKVTCKGGSSSEPILDRFADARNYIDLGYALWDEVNRVPKDQTQHARELDHAIACLVKKDEAAGWPPAWLPQNTAEHEAWQRSGGE